MSQIINLNTFTTSHETAISWITRQLTLLGLLVKPSFDLQVARSAHNNCACPHHGTEQCDCQIVVLLVYGEDEGPVSLIVHGQDGTTFLSMTEEISAEENQSLVDKIVHALGFKNIHIP